MQQPESPIDIRDLLWKIRQYRWLIILPIVVVFCGSFTYLMITKPQYESFVTVSVNDRAPVSAALEPLVRGGEDRQDPRQRISLLDTHIHSRPFLGDVVERLGLMRDPELLLEASAAARRWVGVTPEEYATRVAAARLSKRIRITPVEGLLVHISAMDPDPKTAKLTVSTVADVLVEETKRTTLERAQARGEFSADQMAVYQEQLAKAETALRAFQESQIGVHVSSSLLNDQNLDLARGILRDTDAEIEQIRERIAAELKQWRDGGGGASGPPDLGNSTTSDLESRLASLEPGLATATLQGEKSTGESASLRMKIGANRQALYAEYQSQAASIRNISSENARDAASGIALDRSILRSLREKRQRLGAQVSEYLRRVEGEPRNKMQLERLQQDVTTSRDLLNALRKEATSSRISEALETSQLGLKLAVVEPPLIPLLPVWPNPLKIFGAAILLGPLISIGLVLTSEKLGAVVRTAEQAELEIGARVIGTIPRVEGWKRPGSFLHNNWAAISVLVVLLITGVIFAVHTVVRSNHPEAGSPAGSKR